MLNWMCVCQCLTLDIAMALICELSDAKDKLDNTFYGEILPTKLMNWRHIYLIRNALKLTYSNLVLIFFPEVIPRTPPSGEPRLTRRGGMGAEVGGPGGPWPTLKLGRVGHNAFGPVAHPKILPIIWSKLWINLYFVALILENYGICHMNFLLFGSGG